VRLHMRPIHLTDEGVTDSAIRRLMVDSGDYLDDQLILCRADITSSNPMRVERYLQNFEDMERRMQDVFARDRMQKFQSPLRGDEIMELCGIEPGILVGALKGRIEDAILDGVISYDADEAKRYLLEIKDEVMNMDPEQLSIEIKERSRNRKGITKEFSFPE
ncbi:MAG: hypothetical protein P9M15_01870, partial [Candidatus Electryoneaceae bacterium]|nr:hypothetical protein [Candidatus Electryoneaceae bacterium]